MAFIAYLVATVLLFLAAIKVDTSINLTAWGLVALAAGLLLSVSPPVWPRRP